jgi:hypothetical protein
VLAASGRTIRISISILLKLRVDAAQGLRRPFDPVAMNRSSRGQLFLTPAVVLYETDYYNL